MTFLPFVLCALIGHSYGLSIPFERRSLGPRSTSVSVNSNYDTTLGFSNALGQIYTATIYVQGQPFQVQIDTGSSDLWLDTTNITLEGLQDTGVTGTVSYAQDTTATGPIVLGNVTFGEFTVGDQAFITAPGSNTTVPGYDQGLLGLALPYTSNIYDDLSNTSYNASGYPFLINVFRLNPEVPSFMTLLLSRSDAGITDGGVLSIGEVAQDYVAVLDQPKLPVTTPYLWMTSMAGIYINGQLFTGNSTSSNGTTSQSGEDQFIVALDSGTTLASAPRSYVDAMYKDIPGAVFNESLGYYTLPCETSLNISMVFGSDVYPMDPIDVTAINVNEDGSFYCFGSFFPTPQLGLPIDFILGDAFLHNVYTLQNVGSNFTGHGDEASYIQLLSITDQDEAFANFGAASVRRIVQAEYQEFATLHNMTASSEAAPQTTTYSLVAPSSGWQTASQASATGSYVHGAREGSAATTAVPTHRARSH